MNVPAAITILSQSNHGDLQINHEDYADWKEFWPDGLRWKARPACTTGDGCSLNSGRFEWMGYQYTLQFNKIPGPLHIEWFKVL
jgi:hypothetical protein